MGDIEKIDEYITKKMSELDKRRMYECCIRTMRNEYLDLMLFIDKIIDDEIDTIANGEQLVGA
jgi:hypothetical protein